MHRDLLPEHTVSRGAKQDRLVGMSAEEDPVRCHLKHLPCSVNGAHIDRFVESAQKIERKGMGKADVVPHDIHGKTLEKRKKGFGPGPQLGGTSQQKVFQGEIVVSFHGRDPVPPDQPDKRFQEV